MRTALLSFESDLVRINGGSGKGCSGRGGGGREIEGGVGSAKYREQRLLRINNNQFDFCPFCDLYFICLFLDENSTEERGRKESSANH